MCLKQARELRLMKWSAFTQGYFLTIWAAHVHQRSGTILRSHHIAAHIPGHILVKFIFRPFNRKWWAEEEQRKWQAMDFCTLRAARTSYQHIRTRSMAHGLNKMPRFPGRVGLISFSCDTYSYHKKLGKGTFGPVWQVRRLSDSTVSLYLR